MSVNAPVLRFVCAAWMGVCGASAWGAGGQVESKKAELSDLKGRIESLKSDVAKGEASKADVADQLRDIEQAISVSSRRLRELAVAQGAAQAQLGNLQQQSSALGKQIAAQQDRLGKLLYRQYTTGQSEGLQALLGGVDLNELARDSVYLRALSQAEALWLADLRKALQEKTSLTAAARAKSEELARLETQSRSQQAELLAQRQKRHALMERIAAKLKTQRKEIDSLKRDEARLAKLIQGLARIVKKPRPAPPSVKTPSGVKPTPGDKAPPAPEPVLEPPPSGVAFAHLKGRLLPPLRGELTHRYGSRRADGGASWKGVFIKAGSGEVRAVATGRVVFADWLRGFGNLLILDHGDEYLSVYGNNESLYRGVGDLVKAGEAVAAVGSSGGNEETGLYFELRFQGQTLDPQKWISLK